MRIRRSIQPALLAATLLCGVVGASSEARADVAISDEAREHFRRGVELLKQPAGPNYREAYQAFQAAYSASPSPKILGNLGLCAMKLERYGEAIDFYERYLGEAGAVSPREHRQILDDIIKLKSQMAEVRLVVKPLDASVLDERLPEQGEPVVNEYELRDGRLEAGVRAGKHRFTIRAEGYQEQVWAFEASKGPARERTVELKPLAVEVADPEPAPLPLDDGGAPEVGLMTGAWAALGVTAALGVATGVVGGLALSNHASFDDALAQGDNARAAELRDKGMTLNITTDVLLGTTIAGAAVTAVLLGLGLSADASEPSAWLAPAVGPRGGTLSLGARF